VKLDPNRYGFLPVEEVEQITLENFTCTKERLDQFLKVDAKDYHTGRVGYTTCVFHEDVVGLVGYYTMSNDAIKLNSSEYLDLGLNLSEPIHSIPAVLIGKFAVRKDLQGDGNGAEIMELVIGEILGAAASSAARLVVVDADHDQRVIRFYERCGFQHSLNAQKQAKHQGGGVTVKMFRDVLA
jgi:GNAT superfamily N-acetyltransferase